MVYCAVEGIVGAGKTTLARQLAEILGWRFLEERVDGNVLLERFYEDKARWSFPVQIKFLMQRWRVQNLAANEFITSITDRSLAGDGCFARMLMKAGLMDPLLWDLYQECCYTVAAVRPPMLLVYLDVAPEVALGRVTRRARRMEQGPGVDLPYLRGLHEEYEQMVADVLRGKHWWAMGVEVVRVPWNEERDDVGSAARSLAGMLRDRMAAAERR